LIHHFLVTYWFYQDLGWWQNAWYSKPLGVLQNMTLLFLIIFDLVCFGWQIIVYFIVC
jgi:hypothetical protein